MASVSLLDLVPKSSGMYLHNLPVTLSVSATAFMHN